MCSYDVSGQGMELGLVGRGDMPTAEVIGDGVGATGNVLCAEFEIVECGQEPDLARQACMPGTRERPELRAVTLFALSQWRRKRFPRRRSLQSLRATMIARSSRVLMS